MKTLLIIITSILCITFSQEFDSNNKYESNFKDSKRKQRMESMMIWRLTEELDLKPEQAEKFFPRLREHRSSLDQIRNQEKELEKILRSKLKDNNLDKSEIIAAVKKTTSLRKKHADEEEKFILGLDDLLDTNQLAKLGMFKQKMMRDMGGEMKKMGKRKEKKNRKRGGRRNGGFWN
ncbi:MAG: hypothetical protein CMG74_08175 [Candidatus Marinimicrobia bacterium]|nr:hypothetical protein [Candidatus Neomarinimicrobiota bacterium]|tara:strand:- start:10196 stop:10726 length:531 start_codon:yes stop_codon:yes gene_type:complete